MQKALNFALFCASVWGFAFALYHYVRLQIAAWRGGLHWANLLVDAGRLPPPCWPHRRRFLIGIAVGFVCFMTWMQLWSIQHPTP